MHEPWWKSAVFYQIYPRSFADAARNGVGDLAGVVERLDYLAWLGVDALWLSPFFRSPMRDFGYDVSDYCDVDPIFGTLDDFDALVSGAHTRGLRVIIDWVPAHTSSEHPWFLEARSSRTSPRRDWYIWRDPAPGGGPPNNWIAAFTHESAWQLDEATGQYYLHCFLPAQPDLNWANPEVRRAQHEVLRFWLDRGVDGFRADVVHNIGKDLELPDLPEERAKIPAVFWNDENVTHVYLDEIRQLLDGYEDARIMVGEVGLGTIEQISRFHGEDDALHLAFNFPALFARWRADKWRRCIERTRAATDPRRAWPTWVLSNHDQPRHRTRYGSEARARSAAVLLLTLRGSPFLYMGEELGLEDAVVPPGRVVDPGGRDGCRAPIPWESAPGHGWGPDPWLPFPPAAARQSAAAQREAPDSMLQLYRRILNRRRASPALSIGNMTLLDAPDPVLHYRREAAGDLREIAINFSSDPQPLPAATHLEIELASDNHGESHPFPGHLAPDQSVILRPR